MHIDTVTLVASLHLLNASSSEICKSPWINYKNH